MLGMGRSEIAGGRMPPRSLRAAKHHRLAVTAGADVFGKAPVTVQRKKYQTFSKCSTFSTKMAAPPTMTSMDMLA